MNSQETASPKWGKVMTIFMLYFMDLKTEKTSVKSKKKWCPSDLAGSVNITEEKSNEYSIQ